MFYRNIFALLLPILFTRQILGINCNWHLSLFICKENIARYIFQLKPASVCVCVILNLRPTRFVPSSKETIFCLLWLESKQVRQSTHRVTSQLSVKYGESGKRLTPDRIKRAGGSKWKASVSIVFCDRPQLPVVNQCTANYWKEWYCGVCGLFFHWPDRVSIWLDVPPLVTHGKMDS